MSPLRPGPFAHLRLRIWTHDVSREMLKFVAASIWSKTEIGLALPVPFWCVQLIAGPPRSLRHVR
jgi:hypothetical protein